MYPYGWLHADDAPLARVPLKWSVLLRLSHLEAQSVHLPFTDNRNFDSLVKILCGLSSVNACLFPLQLISNVGDTLRLAYILLLTRTLYFSHLCITLSSASLDNISCKVITSHYLFHVYRSTSCSKEEPSLLPICSFICLLKF